MQSAEDHQQDCAALELSKTCNNKENNESSSVRPRLRSAGRLRGLGHAGGARDAVEPHREIIELSDRDRDALHKGAQLALRETKAKAPKVAQAPSARKQRADAFAGLAR